MSGTVLVTGSGGFIAAHLATALVGRGAEVIGVDIREPDPVLWPADAANVMQDVRDAEALVGLVKERHVTAVVHCAAVVGDPRSNLSLPISVAVNAGGTAAVLEAASQVEAGVTYLSTASVYTREKGEPLREEEAKPIGPYPTTKYMGELVGRMYNHARGVGFVVLRPSFVYGPGSAIGDYLLVEALKKRKVIRSSGADHPCEFTYVSDLVDGIVLAMEAAAAGKHAVYNISSGVMRTRGELAAVVASLVPDATVSMGPGIDPIRNIRPPMDLTRIMTDLGYRPGVSLEEGMRRWHAWCVEHGSFEP